jgi:hypothetical protein
LPWLKKDFLSKNQELENMHKSFVTFCENYKEKKDEIIYIAEYFAEEFSKPVDDNKGIIIK